MGRAMPMCRSTWPNGSLCEAASTASTRSCCERSHRSIIGIVDVVGVIIVGYIGQQALVLTNQRVPQRGRSPPDLPP